MPKLQFGIIIVAVFKSKFLNLQQRYPYSDVSPTQWSSRIIGLGLQIMQLVASFLVNIPTVYFVGTVVSYPMRGV